MQISRRHLLILGHHTSTPSPRLPGVLSFAGFVFVMTPYPWTRILLEAHIQKLFALRLLTESVVRDADATIRVRSGRIEV